jgi:uncharacterized protein
MKQGCMNLFIRKGFILCVSLIAILTTEYSLAYSSPGTPSGFVNDYANIFTADQKSNLENTIRAFNASTTNEIAVVTIKSLQGDYIENYAVQLFKEWGIGTKKSDNGVLLLIALDDRKMRIEVGYGLEGALPDSVAAKIIRDDLTPQFKNADYYGGVTLAIGNIMKATQGEYVSKEESLNPDSIYSFLETFVFFVVIILQVFVSLLARSKSWWAGGVLGAVIGLAITVLSVFGITLTFGIIITVILTLIGLLLDYVVSKGYSNAIAQGTSIPWWSGGSSRSSSGGGFGGFGGGRSGGGGASGSW